MEHQRMMKFLHEWEKLRTFARNYRAYVIRAQHKRKTKFKKI